MKRWINLLLVLSLFSIAQAQEKTHYDIVVAQDGSGNYKTVQEAVSAVRAMMPERKIIFIKKGIYHEKVVIPTYCINISLIGEDRDSTVITWNDHANMPIPGTDTKMGTFKTYTLLVQGHGFKAQNLTIQNNAPQLGQAVALHVEGDQAVFVNCKLLGNQDTYFAGSKNSRQYLKNCYIEGTTDFIFGPATVYFESCEIHSKKDSYITAPSTPQDQEFGFIFHNCKLTADSTITKVYLGRPWRAYGMSAYIKCELGKHILPAGWDNWRDPNNEKTARFIEMGSTGPGADTSQRVKWAPHVCDCKAKEFSPKKVLKGCDNWLPEEASTR
jgi:pectinesterase